MALVAPSILSANFNELLKEVQSVQTAPFLHIDVMDGHFVPNITIGPMVYKNLKKEVDMIFDVHLMIADPLQYAKSFIDAGADYLTFHYETCDNIDEAIQSIQSLGAKAGISIKPNTPIETLKPYLDQLDLILVMSVEPGFGGQAFMPSALEKIAYLAMQKKENNYHYLIEIDGGMNKETAKLAVEHGCEIIVAGTYIFQSENRVQVIKELSLL
ncbi:MAG: ribulose-phosphate 3-epimerase [Bacilli bacterium]|jgi:ribulose-phosphate 3-epimerase|nr:ribulose-phosphate 3-epimerase [Bacilli bacterium]MDY0064071.1 ribulose-phosphate 3-epimerase [Bacilli bacterium]